MSRRLEVTHETTLHIRDHCLCLHVQRAARVIARRFDEALRPLGLTNGQFSLLTSLNRPQSATMDAVAGVLGMDRTTLIAALKPLRRAGLVDVSVDSGDRRSRRLALTSAGRDRLAEAVPVWKKTHAEIDRAFADDDGKRLRRELRILSDPPAHAKRLIGRKKPRR